MTSCIGYQSWIKRLHYPGKIKHFISSQEAGVNGRSKGKTLQRSWTAGWEIAGWPSSVSIRLGINGLQHWKHQCPQTIFMRESISAFRASVATGLMSTQDERHLMKENVLKMLPKSQKERWETLGSEQTLEAYKSFMCSCGHDWNPVVVQKI